MNSRDERNQRKGYQEALLDIANALNVGGIDEVIEWIYNNGNEATRNHADDLMLRVD